MKLKASALIGGYVGFAVVNLGLAHMGALRTPGSSKLLDLNDKLLRFNILARLFPPPVPALMAGQPSQYAIPDGATMTIQPTGTTTTFDA